MAEKNSNYGVSSPRWLVLPAESPGVLGARVAAPRVPPRARQGWDAKAPPNKIIPPGDPHVLGTRYMGLGEWRRFQRRQLASMARSERPRWVFSRYTPPVWHSGEKGGGAGCLQLCAARA